MEKVITRIAPSPTGHLHIGTARTALYNYLFAKKHGGTFIVRSEDTDRARSTAAFEKEILDGLAWLQINADAFYRQSERGHIYRSFLEKLIANDTAYLSKEESKNTPGTFVEVVRLRNKNKMLTFRDEVRGDITFDTTELGDFVIARSLDDALYHFAVVVDDFEMGVTHVIRGEDHISNTPRHILIQEAIGAPRPIYAHLPLILAPDRSKLSKRHGAVALYEYQAQGFLPEAINNYLALLGWNPGTEQEIFTRNELIEAFDLNKIQKSGAIFNVEKLRWFNHEFLQKKDDLFFISALTDGIRHATHNPTYDIAAYMIPNVARLARERCAVLSDIATDIAAGEYAFMYQTPDPTATSLKWKKDASPQDALPRLQEIQHLLEEAPESNDATVIKTLLFPYAEKVGKGEVLWPLRMALSGREKSPDPFSLIAILGKAESIARIKKACDIISG